MAKDDWIRIGEYSNAASARVAAGLLTALGLAHRVRPTCNASPSRVGNRAERTGLLEIAREQNRREAPGVR